MLNLMIDLETLGIDDNSVILQVGLVTFDKNFTPQKQLNMKIDIASSLLDGFTTEVSCARDFWAKQPAHVIRSVMHDNPRLPPKDAANVISKWLDTHLPDEFTIWAHGILFDVPKLDKLLTRYGQKSLTSRTKYNRILDLRTLTKTVNQIAPKKLAHAQSLMGNANEHDAIADCHYQIAMASACMAILSGEYEILKGDRMPEPPKEEKIEVPPQVAQPLMVNEENDPLLNVPDMTDPNEKSWEDEGIEDDDFTTYVLGGSKDG